MDRMRISQILQYIAVFIAVFMMIPESAAQQKESNIHFKWAFGALVGPSTDQPMVAVDNKTALRSGDHLKFYLELLQECYVYLLYYSSQGELAMLFPVQGDDSAHLPRRQFFIPQGDTWFRLDDKVGKEKFYLMASARRLYDLENRYTEHLRLKQPFELQSSARNILEEIKKIKRQNRTLTAPAERPVRLGGNFRGIAKAPQNPTVDVSTIAREVSATDFYSRTITIDHR